MLTLERLLELAGLDEVANFYKIEKLRTLANHPNTSPEEKAAALAAIKRLQPPPPPKPDVPDGGYVNKGKVFSPGPAETSDTPKSKPSYTTTRGKTFV